VELFEYYQEKIGECEEEVEKYLGSLPHVTEEEPPELPLKEKRNLMSFNVRDHAYKMLGVDLFRIRRVNCETILRIVSEVGVDLNASPSEKHFASWLCLNPNRRVSGGKEISSRTNASRNRTERSIRSKERERTKRERERIVANLKKRAKRLGFELVAKAA